MNPKISIITISYNSAKTIERAILSVLNQGYDNLEYIIVDGGSEDGTTEIINKYNKKIAKWVSEPDKGISDAFNKGISFATGDIIGIINSDDGLEPGALEVIGREYDKNTDVYRGNIIFWNEDTNCKTREVPSMKFSYSGLGLRCCHQSTFITKEAYQKYGIYNTAYKYNMDFDLLLRFQNQGAKFKYLNYDIAYFTMGGITFSKTNKDQMLEMEDIIISNGGKKGDVLAYRIVKSIKNFVKKIIKIDWVLRIKNIKYN